MNPERNTESAANSLQALKDIEFIKQLMHRNRRRAEMSAPYLYIWGTYCTLGYLLMYFIQETWVYTYWPAASLICGVASVIVGIRQKRIDRGADSEGSAWVYWLPSLSIFIAGYCLMFMGAVNMEYSSFFFMVLTGILYVKLGTLVGKELVILGFWFMLLSLITRFFFFDEQNLVLGILGGGSIIFTGVLVQRWGRRVNG